jgi:hypothetical protein
MRLNVKMKSVLYEMQDAQNLQHDSQPDPSPSLLNRDILSVHLNPTDQNNGYEPFNNQSQYCREEDNEVFSRDWLES